LFFAATGIEAGVAVEADKNIPDGAGMGGGSADAAGTLMALNELHGRPLGSAALARIGERIGSDVPFFLAAAAAVVTGRGERVKPLSPRTGYPMLLAMPPFTVSTTDAYRWIDEDGVAESDLKSGKQLANMYEKLQPEQWTFTNTFESVLFPRFPELERVIETMYSCDALFSRVTGSGSAVYALFEAPESRERAKNRLSASVFSFWDVEMLARNITVVLQ
jgi:4-diphosphocytidyl-2-C-methyl-D-erythritol kinase